MGYYLIWMSEMLGGWLLSAYFETLDNLMTILKTVEISKAKQGPLRKFCVSEFRQTQEYHYYNVHDGGLYPLSTSFPGGWDGMRAGTA